jgi:hypothetical protein
MKDVREDEELRDGGEKSGRYGTRERKRGRCRTKKREISDGGEDRRWGREEAEIRE